MKVLICTILIAIAFGASLRGFNVQRQRPVLSFNQVFVQVKSMIAAKGPYSDVYNLLGDIKAQLLSEQAAQTAIYNDQMKDCGDELTLRSGEMGEATNAMTASDTQRTACSGALSEAQITEGTLDATLTLKTQALAAERALRASQIQVFEVFQQDLVDQIANIKLAITYAQELSSTVSTESMNTMFFPQLSAKLAISAISTNSFEKMAPIFFAMSSLVQVTQFDPFDYNDDAPGYSSWSADQNDAPGYGNTTAGYDDTPVDYGVVGAEGDDASQLITLLDELLTETEQQLVDLRNEESGRASAFVTNEGNLQSVMQLLTDELVEVRAHMVEMTTCVSVETSVYNQASAKWSRNNGIYQATETMCNTFEREYTDANEARNTELALLEALDELVKEELSGGVRGSALTRGDAEQEDWIDHEHESVYAHDGETFQYGSPATTWVQGDGIGGDEQYLAMVSSYEECEQLVRTEKPTANGATVETGGVGECYAEFGQTGINDNPYYENTSWEN